MTIRPTGIDTPFGGFSWEFTKSDKECANRILKLMEDRRGLYNPQMLEDSRHCIESVLEIREFLTTEIQDNSDDMKINNEIESMRRYCRDFLNKEETDFLLALATFRHKMIASIEKLSSVYCINLCGELSDMINNRY